MCDFRGERNKGGRSLRKTDLSVCSVGGKKGMVEWGYRPVDIRLVCRQGGTDLV